MLKSLLGWTLLILSLPVVASEMEISLEIPRLNVAEYHRPYVAIWIEKETGGVVANLAVWYDTDLRENKGQEWLKDMRQWWRRTGRELQLPIDGISGATRAPGTHQLIVRQGEQPLGDLAPGNYRLLAEAAREVGGREVLTLAFQWPPQQAHQETVQGKEELASFTVKLKP